MPLKKIFFFFIIVLLFSFVLYETKAQQPVFIPDAPVQAKDSLKVASDSTALLADTVPHRKTNAIDAPVYYQSKDSIVMTGTNFIYLFGEGNVKYQNLELTADYIQVNNDSSTVYATFSTDSIGDEIGYPIFKEGESQYESKTMRYNFKTKKGYITDVITQQGEGYVTSGRTKKMDNDDLFMVDGKYTTCDEHDHPHFYLKMTKAKVRPGHDIVTGPAYLVIEDVPLPVAIPFGYFPFKGDYASGIIMPTYGDELSRGFSLRDGGYYFAFNDYMDLALTGEIYTKGSWGINARSSYRKRYKFSGGFNVGYLVTVLGDKGEPDYSKSKDFKAMWNHSQDPKSNPYRTLSANVNFSTSTYDRNQVGGYVTNAQTQNIKSSSVNVSQTFPNSPFSLNANMTINQRSQDSTVSVTLPSLSISMRQVYPFKRKNPVGSQRWYENISVSYQGKLDNSFSGKEDKLFNSSLQKDWRNGMTHSIPVSATFNLLNYINITPSVNYSERWNTMKVTQDYDPNKNGLAPADTTHGFYRSYNYSASIGLNTKLYGFFKPWKMFGDKVQMIRHVLTPSISFSGAPDFSDPRYGSYVDKIYIDKTGKIDTARYSPYQYSLYPPGGGGKSASLSFGIDNNVEMKVKSDSDSTGIKKISLIDQLSFRSGYNFLADQFNWSDISASLRLKLTKSYSVNLSGMFDVYTYKVAPDGRSGQRVNVTRWEAGKGIGRFRGTSYSQSYTFTNDTFKKWFGKKDDSSKTEDKAKTDEDLEQTNVVSDEIAGTTGVNAPLRSGKKDRGEFDSDGYAIFNIPWSLSVNYGINWGYDMSSFNVDKLEYNYKISQTLSLSGNIQPTKGWRFNFTTSYDFDYKKFAYMNCSVTRDLHCWSMSAGFSPVGDMQYYNFTISVNSSLLQDLKYTQSSNYRDAMKWE